MLRIVCYEIENPCHIEAQCILIFYSKCKLTFVGIQLSKITMKFPHILAFNAIFVTY